MPCNPRNLLTIPDRPTFLNHASYGMVKQKPWRFSAAATIPMRRDHTARAQD
jgi:hypothetical protein